MIISGLTAANISSTVWSQATRALTNAGFRTITSVANGSLATATQLVIQPAAGKVRWVTVAITQPAGGAGNATIEVIDGVQAFVLATATPGTTANIALMLSTNGVALRLNNQNNTNATKYAYNYLEDTV